MTGNPTILLVEGDDLLAGRLLDHLRAAVGAEVHRAPGASAAMDLVCERPPGLMLVNDCLPDGDGLELVRDLRSTVGCPVMIITGRPSIERTVEAMRLGVEDLLIQPLDLRRLTCVVSESLARYQQNRKDQHRLQRLERLTHKILHERKMLQERFDLVCGDLVSAYRDLAGRVVRLRPPESKVEH